MARKWWLVILLTAVGAHAQHPVTLEWCVRTALAENPGLQQAQTETRSADEDVKQATASFLPSFDASGSFRKQSMVPEIDIPPIQLPFGGAFSPFPEGGLSLGLRDTYDFRLTLSQPIFTGFRLINRKRITDAGGLVKHAEEIQKRNELIQKVEAAFGNLLKAKKFLEIALSAREQIQAHVDDVERFYVQGMIKKDELLKTRVKMTEAELVVLQAGNGVELAVVFLSNFIGRPLPPDAAFDWTASEAVPFNLEAAVQSALVRRPELEVVRQAKAAAEAGRKLARGGYFPSIAAFGTFGYGKPGIDLIGKKWMDYWIVGAGAEWNLWSWGKTRSQMRQASLKAVGLSEMERQVRDAVVLDVTQACLRLDEAQKRLDLTKQMQEQSKESFRVAENLYKQGQSSHTEFFDAQSEWTRSQSAKAQAEIDLMVARANWRKAVGENSYSDVK